MGHRNAGSDAGAPSSANVRIAVVSCVSKVTLAGGSRKNLRSEQAPAAWEQECCANLQPGAHSVDPPLPFHVPPRDPILPALAELGGAALPRSRDPSRAARQRRPARSSTAEGGAGNGADTLFGRAGV
jgi:hypothetical protein